MGVGNLGVRNHMSLEGTKGTGGKLLMGLELMVLEGRKSRKKKRGLGRKREKDGREREWWGLGIGDFLRGNTLVLKWV